MSSLTFRSSVSGPSTLSCRLVARVGLLVCVGLSTGCSDDAPKKTGTGGASGAAGASGVGGVGGGAGGAGGTTTAGKGGGGGGGGTSGGGGGTSGGSSGAGGLAGGGGTGGANCAAAVPIDNFDDPASAPLWRVYTDGTTGGTITPFPVFQPETGDQGSLGLHLKGNGFTDWGAGAARKYDGKGACVAESLGVRFRAKGPGTIAFQAGVAAIVPESAGGKCTAAEEQANECNNLHEKRVTLTATWADYEVKWKDLAQLPGWGKEATFSASEVVQLDLAVYPDAMPFDFWVDDVVLLTTPSGGGTGGAGGSGGQGGQTQGGSAGTGAIGGSSAGVAGTAPHSRR